MKSIEARLERLDNYFPNDEHKFIIIVRREDETDEQAKLRHGIDPAAPFLGMVATEEDMAVL